MVLGLPFNLFWLLLWIVLTTVCMWGAYRIELSREAGRAPHAREQDPPE
jgi:membrane protein required for beta-lactamase induction